MIVGEFKQGKSTVLNALLGDAVLPQKAAPCTAIPTLIRYGETPEVAVIYGDGRIDGGLTPQEFAHKYELKVADALLSPKTTEDWYELNEVISDRFGDILQAEISYPVKLCQDGVEVVDTPGLEEHPARSARVYRHLDRADAIIMVLNATRLMDQREIVFVQQKLQPPDLHTRLFFVINRWNQLLDGVLNPDDAEEVNQHTREIEELIDVKVAPYCSFNGCNHPDHRIFRVDALGALKLRRKRPIDSEALEATSIPAFERSLERFLLEDRSASPQIGYT